MEYTKIFATVYLDKEKDIIVNFYKMAKDELTYILETPNHGTGNLITNLAKICNIETCENEKGMKIIQGQIPASVNNKNEDIYIFELGGFQIANIFSNGKVEIIRQIPVINKTLMSQTKDYKIPIEKTIVKSYILKKIKFRTDLHTHLNANLSPDCLIALGIKHQIEYPLYYIKKLGLKMSKEQEKNIYSKRSKIAKRFENSGLIGKKLERKIDDLTNINFAEFILNNLENANKNLEEIRKSLAILKDGQAVFTNLEKLYLYRYVFSKGNKAAEKLDLEEEIDKIEKIPQREIKENLLKMLKDKKEKSIFKMNTLRQDKLLWIAREYKSQGIKYAEISDTTLAENILDAIEMLEDIHNILPKIEKQTGVKLRFLVAIRKNNLNNIGKNLNILKAVSKSPYIVGCDFIGEEINDISQLKPAIKEIVNYIIKEDNGYTIRIHAGENDNLRDNVAKSIKYIKEAIGESKIMPRIRIGHGLYTANLNTKKGIELIQNIKNANAIIEFQITSNIRLNNLSNLNKHPLKKYLQNGIKCVQGTDGGGLYGTSTIEEQIATQNLLDISEKEFEQMRNVEDEIMQFSKKYFIKKTRRFKKLVKDKTIKQAILELENNYNLEKSKIKYENTRKIETKKHLQNMIVQNLPLNKLPIIIAGGSFNSKGINTNIEKNGIRILEKMVNALSADKSYFVIGDKFKGYEKEIINICKKQNKNFEIYAIVPKLISKKTKEDILNSGITGICVSIENESSGIYKSFNYEIFERRSSIVIAFDGNSPALNLIQEAKNGKAKSKIFVNKNNDNLKQKANLLGGYVRLF